MEVFMSNLKVLIILISLLVFELVIIVIARYVGLSQFVSVGVGFVPTLLLAFPLIKRWNGGNLSFIQWTLAVCAMVVAAALIHFTNRLRQPNTSGFTNAEARTK